MTDRLPPLSPSGQEPPRIPGLTHLRRIGTGGYSDVHLYEQAITRQEVAVKVIRPRDRLSSEQQAEFEVEAQTMAQLSGHPNIVQVFSAGITSDGSPFLVMRYYPGGSLDARSKAQPLTVPEVLSAGIKIAGAVAAAHQAGVLHRDIKPANILLDQYGEPGLADFGIASSTTLQGTLTSGALSIPWAPPEVLADGSRADARADIYSLAATLWHLLVGRPPFEDPGGDNGTRAVMGRIFEGQLQALPRVDVPPAMTRLLRMGMAASRDERPTTAVEMARAMQDVERQAGWTPTPIVGVSAEAPSSLPHLGDGEGDRTIRRKQPAWQAAVVPAGGSDAATVQRATAGLAPTMEVAALPPVVPTRRRGWVAAAVLAPVAVIALVLGAVVTFAGSPQRPHAVGLSSSQRPQSPGSIEPGTEGNGSAGSSEPAAGTGGGSYDPTSASTDEGSASPSTTTPDSSASSGVGVGASTDPSDGTTGSDPAVSAASTPDTAEPSAASQTAPDSSASQGSSVVAPSPASQTTTGTTQNTAQTVDQPTSPSGAQNETTGGVTHTWSNYTNAGGTAGPVVPSNTTVSVSCRRQGFKVADGNTWWYLIASSPWNSAYWASADAFYNNGRTSGSLSGTPYDDPSVPTC